MFNNKTGIENLNADRYLKYLKGPMFMSWDITNRCNMNCRHCLNRSNDNTRHNYQDELTESEIKNVIKQIIDIKPYSICMCGGEPTLSPYLLQIIRELSDADINVSMVSNGYFIDNDLANRLKEAGLKYIQISIDGVDSKTHDNFRKTPGAFERAIQAVKNLIENNLTVATSFSPNKTNINQFNEYIDFMYDLGVREVRVMPLLPMGRGLDEFEALEPSAEDYLKLANVVSKKKIEMCGKMFSIEHGDPLEHLYLAQGGRKEAISMEIKSNGDIGISPYLPIVVGNVKKHTLREYWDGGYHRIWGNKDVQKLLKKIITLEDFKQMSLRTWSIDRKDLDLLEEI